MTPTAPFRVTATGDAYDSGNAAVVCTMAGARLFAAAAAATAIIREVDGAGKILCELTAPINNSDEFRIPVQFKGKIHVTLAGAGASCTVYV